MRQLSASTILELVAHYQALLDGLTDAEIWTDDNFNIIKRVSFEHGGLSGTQKLQDRIEYP